MKISHEDYDEAIKFCKECNRRKKEKHRRYNEAVNFLNVSPEEIKKKTKNAPYHLIIGTPKRILCVKS